MTTLAFLALATVFLGAAAVAMSLRNLIHSALLLVFSWAGVAGFYLWAGAEFVAFAQVLVYVGAVSMVVLFAILLTRQSQIDVNIPTASIARAAWGLVVGGAVLGVLAGAVVSTRLPVAPGSSAPALTVKQLGQQLMGPHAAGLLIIGVLLTVALLGAVVIAATDRTDARRDPPSGL